MESQVNSISIQLPMVVHHNILKLYEHCNLISAWVSFFDAVVVSVLVDVGETPETAMVMMRIVVAALSLTSYEYWVMTFGSTYLNCSIVTILDDSSLPTRHPIESQSAEDRVAVPSKLSGD